MILLTSLLTNIYRVTKIPLIFYSIYEEETTHWICNYVEERRAGVELALTGAGAHHFVLVWASWRDDCGQPPGGDLFFCL